MKNLYLLIGALIFSFSSLVANGESVYLPSPDYSPSGLVNTLNTWQEKNKAKKILSIVGNLSGSRSPVYIGFWIVWTPQDEKELELSETWLLKNNNYESSATTNLLNGVEKQNPNKKIVCINQITGLRNWFIITRTDKKVVTNNGGTPPR